MNDKTVTLSKFNLGWVNVFYCVAIIKVIIPYINLMLNIV